MPNLPVSLDYPGHRSGWGEDPILVAEDMGIAERRMKRLYIPLNQARAIIMEDIQEHFTTQTDPDGVPWEEWSESYDARQTNLGDILQRTYALEYAATNPDSWLVISHSQSAGAYGSGEVALVGSNLPDYWIWHEEGISDRESPRGPNPLPRRSFAGVSDEAQEKIYATFEAYFDRALVGTLVTGQPMGRGGRFARRF